MRLKVWIPTDAVLDEEVIKIKAEAETGWFGILPRHVDFVTALVPGILSFELPDKQMGYLAIDQGILVKCGPAVSVSTRNAVRSTDPGQLKEAVVEEFRKRGEKERNVRQFEAKLEAELVRQLLKVEKHV